MTDSGGERAVPGRSVSAITDCECITDSRGECVICDDPYNEDGPCSCHEPGEGGPEPTASPDPEELARLLRGMLGPWVTRTRRRHDGGLVAICSTGRTHAGRVIRRPLVRDT